MLTDRPLHLRVGIGGLYERNGYELMAKVENFPIGNSTSSGIASS